MESSRGRTLLLILTFAVVAATLPEDSRREELSSGTATDACDHPEQCGPNSECRSLLGLPMCRCLPDFVGSPPSCSRRCVSELDCPEGQACLPTKQGRVDLPRSCTNPCAESCGLNAECLIEARRAKCACPKGWFGDPSAICRECNSHADCPADRPACIFEISCENQCEGLCGAYAHCRIATNNSTGHSMPVCSCPEGRTGNPFEYCRLVDQGNPCSPSPCGPNTDCRPTRDYRHARCGCLPGHFGDPRSPTGCELGRDCVGDDDCPQDRSCLDSVCQDPCADPEAYCPDSRPTCLVRAHKAVCRSAGCAQTASNDNATLQAASDCREGPVSYIDERDVSSLGRRHPRPRAFVIGNDTSELTA